MFGTEPPKHWIYGPSQTLTTCSCSEHWSIISNRFNFLIKNLQNIQLNGQTFGKRNQCQRVLRMDDAPVHIPNNNNDSAIIFRFIDWFVNWWFNLCGCIRVNINTAYDWGMSSPKIRFAVLAIMTIFIENSMFFRDFCFSIDVKSHCEICFSGSNSKWPEIAGITSDRAETYAGNLSRPTAPENILQGPV